MVIKTAHVLVVAVAASVALAAPASADEEAFVRPLATRYVFLSDQQLLSEGARVCDAIASGMPAADATIMVRNDLGISVSAAGEIVSAAVVHLDC
jgi:hypothetical protein